MTARALSAAWGSMVFWGIVLGLVAGKVVGIWGPSVLVERLSGARLPAGVRGDQVLGIAALGGIGFTVALFITSLAFADPALVDVAKLGVLAGSATSAAVGSAILLWTIRRRGRAHGAPRTDRA